MRVRLTAVPSRVDGPAGEVDREGAEVDPLGFALAPARATERRPDARDELLHLERLLDVVVGTGFESDDDIDGVGAGREHDDRHRRGSADRPAHLEAVETRQHHVEQDEIEGLGREPIQAGLAVGGSRRP